MPSSKRTARACFASHTGHFVSIPVKTTVKAESRMSGDYRYHCIHDSSSEDSHLHWPKHYLNKNK